MSSLVIRNTWNGFLWQCTLKPGVQTFALTELLFLNLHFVFTENDF